MVKGHFLKLIFPFKEGKNKNQQHIKAKQNTHTIIHRACTLTISFPILSVLSPLHNTGFFLLMFPCRI
jgi:hypothetical protein